MTFRATASSRYTLPVIGITSANIKPGLNPECEDLVRVYKRNLEAGEFYVEDALASAGAQVQRVDKLRLTFNIQDTRKKEPSDSLNTSFSIVEPSVNVNFYDGMSLAFYARAEVGSVYGENPAGRFPVTGREVLATIRRVMSTNPEAEITSLCYEIERGPENVNFRATLLYCAVGEQEEAAEVKNFGPLEMAFTDESRAAFVARTVESWTGAARHLWTSASSYFSGSLHHKQD